MRILVTILTVLGALAAASLILVYSGTYDVAADRPTGRWERWLLRTAQERSVARSSREIEAPDLADLSRIQAGAEHFAEMCQGCHGAPGLDRSEIGQGLNPRAPNLSTSAGEKEPAQLFWIVKHGIKMTGMPAFGATHSDDQVWSIVAFASQLPKMSPGEYQAQTTVAETWGGGHSHDEDEHDREEAADDHSHSQ